MLSLWTLSSRDIEWYVASETILERGRRYYRSGRVLELHLVTQEHLRARVRGQAERFYRVEVWTEGEQFYSQCSCPYSWGVCKHVAAVLFTWLDRREQMAERQSEPQEASSRAPRRDLEEPLSAWLERIPPDILRDILLEESRTNSAVEDALWQWKKVLRPERIPERIALLLRAMTAASQEKRKQNEEQIRHLLAWAKTFDSHAAGAIAREMLKRLAELLQRRPDIEVTNLIAPTLELLEHHAEAFLRDGPFVTFLVRHLVRVFLLARPSMRVLMEPALLKWADRWGRRADVIAELTERLVEPDAGAYAVLAKLYYQEGRIEEYEAARQKSLISEEDYLELFDHYLVTNYPDRAMRVGEQGVKLLGAKAPRLAERLAALYREWGESERARKILKHA